MHFNKLVPNGFELNQARRPKSICDTNRRIDIFSYIKEIRVTHPTRLQINRI